MTDTKIAFAAGLVLATLIAAAPAQAATRQVEMGMQTFADRCINQGGLFQAADTMLSCQTASVQVDCIFFNGTAAECSWPGIDNRVAVNRLIGMGSVDSLNESLDASPSAPGPKKPVPKPLDLPFKWN